MDQIKQGSNSRVEYTIAGNMGNMIAQLSLQVANLQTALQQKNEEITKLKAENDKLKIENQALKKEVMKHEPSANNTNNKQINK